MAISNDTPLHAFRFEVTFKGDSIHPGEAEHSEVRLCSGGFSECTGLEATMEPKVIKVGGANYGAAQRVGPVSFATVVLKRGMTSTRDLWQWFQLVNSSNRNLSLLGADFRLTGYAYRLSAEIAVQNAGGETVFTWALARALPVKFKAADLNAKGSEVGIEELHLAHEGLTLIENAGGGL
ncbi:MAG: phage tail protein [Nevskia sp.]